jgi:hypothetical protein
MSGLVHPVIQPCRQHDLDWVVQRVTSHGDRHAHACRRLVGRFSSVSQENTGCCHRLHKMHARWLRLPWVCLHLQLVVCVVCVHFNLQLAVLPTILCLEVTMTIVVLADGCVCVARASTDTPGIGRETSCAMIVLRGFGRCRSTASMVAIVLMAQIRSVCRSGISCAATSTPSFDLIHACQWRSG